MNAEKLEHIFQLIVTDSHEKVDEVTLVFRSKTGTPIESGHLRRSFRLALSKAGVEDFHPESLRDGVEVLDRIKPVSTLSQLALSAGKWKR